MKLTIFYSMNLAYFIGSSTAAVTSTTTKPAATVKAETPIGTFSPAGCYADITNGYHIWNTVYYSDSMTQEMCAKDCAGYNYFGVEYGREVSQQYILET
jgi:hypothetical protein